MPYLQAFGHGGGLARDSLGLPGAHDAGRARSGDDPRPDALRGRRGAGARPVRKYLRDNPVGRSPVKLSCGLGKVC